MLHISLALLNSNTSLFLKAFLFCIFITFQHFLSIHTACLIQSHTSKNAQFNPGVDMCVNIYCTFVFLWLCVESIHGREWDGKIEQGKKRKRPAWGFHYCAPLSTEGPRHVTELLPCGGSGSLAGLHPPDSLSPCLQWLPARQFTFNYLLSQTHSEEVQKHSIKTFWRFYPLRLIFGHLEWVAQICVTSWSA